MRFRNAAPACLLWILPHMLDAQRTPAAGGLTTSIGQPDALTVTVGFGLGLVDLAEGTGGKGEAHVGGYWEMISRSLGGGGLHVEGYTQVVNARFGGGARARLMSQVTGIAVGIDYEASQKLVRGILSYVYPGRRSGVFGDGSTFRIDFISGTNRTLSFGIEKSIFDRIPPGTKRPTTDRKPFEGHPPSKDETRNARRNLDSAFAGKPLREVLDTARAAAGNIQRFVVPWLDHTGGAGDDSDKRVIERLKELKHLASDSGANLNIDRETIRFHDAIDKAFALAIVEDSPAAKDAVDVGQRLGKRARVILLDQVIFPYNYTLGQVKRDDTTLGMDTFARGAFLTQLFQESGGSDATHRAVSFVFDALLDMVEQGRKAARSDWSGSRFVWLPLQYGLRAEQYDTQDEFNIIVERATQQPFTTGNHVSYVINEQFQHQLSRTIRETENYHVLWTHDFRGVNDDGNPDSLGFKQAMAYLAALTARVNAYDSTGTFPTYIILLDEWFYEVNNGRLWMNLLENPTGHKVHLSPKFGVATDTVQHRIAEQIVAMEDSVDRAQVALRAAIAHSRLLTEHASQYGKDWLDNLVKVHVNITNAPDPSFWSWRVVKGIPIPDGWMRDHRKIVFHDLSESDLDAGEAIFTGAGIGEHYTRSWEDRSLVVKGPVNLRLISAARDALMKQGMDPAAIPAVLQPTRVLNDVKISIDRSTRPGNVPMMQLQNGTGFDTKEINVGKAVFYTLMPKGSFIKIPDSIWNGTFWGAALIGAALRGVSVVVIAPSELNAPARAFGSMIRGRELLWRLLKAKEVLAEPIESAGGMLEVGIFNSRVDVTDIHSRLRAIPVVAAQHPWIGRLYPFALTMNPELVNSLPPSTCPQHPADTVLLHLKANFFASKEGWSVMARPEWNRAMEAFSRQRIKQLNASCGTARDMAEEPDSAQIFGNLAVDSAYARMDPAVRSRVIFYSVLGSANQNDRSMVSDGEAAMVLSQWPAVIPYIDLLLLVGQSRWDVSADSLDVYLPRKGALKTRIAHWFKHMF